MNKLAKEPSLYLRQHSNNLVDWQTLRDSNPFEKAKLENKPVFISIGYSSCHWCHVMSRESFDNAEIAEILNTKFIPVKIDREEYPDIDKKYQFYLQVTGKNGGWPLSVFTDEAGNPFFAGTYFPPTEQYGMTSFKDILNQISDFFQNNKEKLKNIIESYINVLNEYKKIDNIAQCNERIFIEKVEEILDFKNGGLKGNTKFPNIPTLIALTDDKLYENDKIKSFLELTADKLCTSGIYDHINGGFFRYCIDENWNIPHFEKMLYDNALNVSFLSKMYELTENELYKYTAEKTLDFLMDDFFTENGFIASMNAESLDYNGKITEGFYYLVEQEELEKLPEKDINILTKNTFLKNNFINLQTTDYQDVIKTHTILEKLNKNKTQPTKDTKIIISWNSLLVKAMLDYFEVSSDEFYLNAGLNLFSKIKQNYDGVNLYRIRYDDSLLEHSCLEDYAYLLLACKRIFDITKERNVLLFAENLINRSIQLFFDDNLLYFDLAHSVFDTYDEAVPSAFGCLIETILYFNDFIKLNCPTEKLIQIAKDRFNKFPLAHPTLLNSIRY